MKTRQVSGLALVAVLSGGCSLLTVADAAITVAATTVKVGAKVVGAGVDAILPDDDEDEKGAKKSERN